MRRISLLLLLWVSLPSAAALSLFKNATPEQTNAWVPMEALTNHTGTLQQVDALALRQFNIGDAFEYTIDGVTYVGKVNRITTSKRGSYTIQGHAHSAEGSFSATITLGKHSVFMTLGSEHGLVELSGNQGIAKLAFAHELAPALKQGQTDAIIPQVPNQALPEAARARPKTTNATNTSNEIATLDMLVVYTDEAADLYDGDVASRIDHLIEFTNQTYLDSDVYITINLVDSMSVAYEENTLNEALSAIYSGEGVFSGVAQRRKTSGADLVALLKPYAEDDEYAGLAYINDTRTYYAQNTMYSATNITAGGSTFAHEIGHNLGLGHSRPQGSAGAAFNFGVGYRIPLPNNEGFSTIMAYPVQDAPGIARYSDPTVMCGPVPCGVSETHPAQGSNARLALNATRFAAAATLPSTSERTAVNDALNAIGDSQLRTCLQSAVAGTQVQYAEELTYLSCYGRNISSTTGISAFSNLRTLRLQNNNLTELGEITALERLNGLFLSGNQITSLANIGVLTNLTDLEVGSNQLTSLAGVEQLPELSYLDAQNNAIAQLPQFAADNKLAYVSFYSMDLRNLEGLTDAAHLYFLDIGNNEISALPANLNWPTMYELSLFNNQFTDVTSLSALDGINKLNLSYNDLTSLDGLAPLTQLTQLNANVNLLTNIDAIAGLKNLTKLELTSNQLSSLDAISGLSNLRELTASINNLTTLPNMSDLLMLQRIIVGDNQLTAFNELAGLPRLVYVALDGNPIDSLPTPFNFPALDGFSLQDANLMDITPLLAYNGLHDGGNIYFRAFNTTLPCWQLDYAAKLFNIVSTIEMSCSASTDSADFDNDGMNNTDEINAGRNPLQDDTKPAVVEFAQPTITLAESDINFALQYPITLVRTGESAAPVSVMIESEDGTAVVDTDYTGFNQSTSIGAEGGRLYLDILSDEEFEQQPETFTLTLVEATGAEVGPNNSMTVSIVDLSEPTRGAIRWQLLYAGAQEGQGVVDLLIRRPAGQEGAFTIGLDAQAINGNSNSFNLLTPTLNFDEGVNDRYAQIEIIDDNVINPTQYVRMSIVDSDNTDIQSEYATLTLIISDNDTPTGTVGFSATSRSVGEDAGDVEIVVRRTGGSNGEYIVNVAVTGGSATAGDDYSFTDTTLTFAAGETERTLTLNVVDDDTAESNETVVITLTSDNSNAIGSSGELTITITDNDSDPVVLPPPPAEESGGGGSLWWLLAVAAMVRVYRRNRPLH